MPDPKIQSVSLLVLEATSAVVEILIADHPDRDKAKELLSIRTRIEFEANPPMKELLLKALHSARDVLGAEIQAARSLRDRDP